MRLAEALMLRADCQTRVQQITKRIVDNVKVQEGDEPAEDPNKLLKELNQTIEQQTDLIQRINKTNCQTAFNDKLSLADSLALRDKLYKKRSILDRIIDESTIKQNRYSKAEIRFMRTVDVKSIQKEMDQISKEYRELDSKIQEKNWTTDLL